MVGGDHKIFVPKIGGGGGVAILLTPISCKFRTPLPKIMIAPSSDVSAILWLICMHTHVHLLCVHAYAHSVWLPLHTNFKKNSSILPADITANFKSYRMYPDYTKGSHIKLLHSHYLNTIHVCVTIIMRSVFCFDMTLELAWDICSLCWVQNIIL